MKKFAKMCLGAAVLFGCSHSPTTSSDARDDLDDLLKNRVGTATKEDLTEVLGKPNWCRVEDSGIERCRFLRLEGEKWQGDKKFQENVALWDEVQAEFGTDGTLRMYRVKAQR